MSLNVDAASISVSIGRQLDPVPPKRVGRNRFPGATRQDFPIAIKYALLRMASAVVSVLAGQLQHVSLPHDTWI